MKKRCTNCQQTKSRIEFSKNPSCKDGLRSQCKACVAIYGAAYRVTHREEKAAYNAAHKVEIAIQQATYQKTSNGKAVHAAGNRRDRAEHPQRTWCRNQFNYAITAGKIKRGVCINGCKGKAEGHHLNYHNPFAVIWLCVKCHAAWHSKPLNQYFLNRMNEERN